MQIFIGGVNSPVDLEDLQMHTNHDGLCDDGGFWNVSSFVGLVQFFSSWRSDWCVDAGRRSGRATGVALRN